MLCTLKYGTVISGLHILYKQGIPLPKSSTEYVYRHHFMSQYGHIWCIHSGTVETSIFTVKNGWLLVLYIHVTSRTVNVRKSMMIVKATMQ